MSYYPHGSAAAIRLNLRWRDPHQVNDFNFDSAGEVQDCQTETEHTGWVILHPHSSISVRHLLLRGAISFTGLYYGTEFPLALAAINAEPVRREGWQCFWQFVRQPKIPVSSKELRKHQPDGALVSPRYAALESTTKREVKSPD